jgi:maleylpyruvate isomerase
VNEAELSDRLAAVTAAEDRLLRTVSKLSAAELRGASLLPGWTRGHVLAHVALNAHSLVNLFAWARTGIETPQYPSWEERDSAIETHSRRTLSEHRAALAEAAAAFGAAARAVPLDRWEREVAGIGGDPQPAETFLFGRLREVEIHHVDLDAGYVASDWDGSFVRRVLEQVPVRLSPGVDAPFVAVATDLGTRLEVGDSPATAEVAGAGHDLLAWLLGRADGVALDVRGGTLPRVPSWG